MDVSIGNRLYQYRRKSGLSQEELAAKRKSTEYIAFVFVEERYLRNAVQVYKAAGGYYLCGYHMGTIAKRDAVLSQMMQHIEAEGHEVIGPALIVNLADENDSSDESDFLYQIQIPIVRNL